MAKRKQLSELKVTVNFTPVMDWHNRLKRVMALLLRSQPDQSSSNATGAGTNSKDKEVTGAD